MFDIMALTIGIVIGIFALSKTEQARLQRFLSMNRKNMGLLKVKRKGKGVASYVRNFNEPDLTVGNEKYINNAERVYMEGGIPVAYANEGSTELIDLDAQAREEVYPFDCPNCKEKLEITASTLRPIPNPKVYNDIVVRAFSWGMTMLQDKRTQMLLIAIAIGVLVTVVNAFLTYQNGQAIGTINGRLDGITGMISALKNSTVTK
jgi:hypothetical protein